MSFTQARCRLPIALIFVCLLSSLVQSASAQTVARCGKGWLETVNGYSVLHLKGTPYEMGFQHGALLKEHVRQNLETMFRIKAEKPIAEWGPVVIKPRPIIESIIRIQEDFVPKKYAEEIAGLAAGASIPLEDARVANFIPELFHCSGFAVMNSATRDGTLYHGRVLDYAIDWGLQEHAVLIVAEPDKGIPFVNVTYAGFIGSVTGMNAKSVSIGEMGGGGVGHWKGVPMAFLVREALETGRTLESAIRVFRDNPRTCQYFYVIADGKTNRAVGLEASWNRFDIVRAGTSHPLLPKPVKDCALLSAGSRYDELVKRVKAKHGTITAQDAMRLMDRPVAMKSNLHNVLFEPKTTRFWIANAGIDGTPAADREYQAFQLTELLKRRPETSSPEIPLTVQTARREGK